jgi:hypothetical protein
MKHVRELSLEGRDDYTYDTKRMSTGHTSHLMQRRRTPQPTPSPIAVAHISRLEGEANAHPTNVDKQLELFFALVETKTQAGRDLIMARWERMCEFVRCFTCYLP